MSYNRRDTFFKGVIMTTHIQMTFVPNANQDKRFFMFLTDEQDNIATNFRLLNVIEYHPLMNEYLDDYSQEADVSIQLNQRNQTVHGCYVPMDSVFNMMIDPRINQQVPPFRLGSTSLFLKEMADALQILAENGQFFPFMYHIDKYEETYFFSHWLPNMKLMIESELLEKWKQELPNSVLTLGTEWNTDQGLNLLITLWMDHIIRSQIHISNLPFLDNWSRFDHDNPLAHWYENLIHFNDSPFFIADHENDVRKMEQYEHDIHDWTEDLLHAQSPDMIHDLISFRSYYIEPKYTPEKIELHLDPMNPDQPFHSETLWSCHVMISGYQQNERKKISIIDFINRGHQALEWFISKLYQVSDLIPYSLFNIHQTTSSSIIISPGEMIQLYQEASSLSNHNFTCFLPEWLNISESNSDIDVQLELESGDSLFGLSSLINYNWRISVGSINLTAAEFKQLVKQKQPFIKRGDEWIHLPLDKLVNAYHSFDETSSVLGHKPNLADALRLQTITKQKSKKNPIAINTSRHLDEYFSGLLKKPKKNIPLPKKFTGKLRPYQKKGYTWLVNLRDKQVGGCLADDMGLGKTIQAISYIAHTLDLKQTDHDTTLIICPTSLLANWQREFQSFAPDLNIYVHHGPNRYPAKSIDRYLKDVDVLITSYTIFTRECEDLEHYTWASVILDEGQAIKNPNTKKSRAMRRIQADHRIVLTGTPMENKLEELWSIMEFLNPGYLGPLQKFREAFVRPIEKRQDKKKSKMLTKMIQPFLLRREKTDRSIIQDLPDKIETKETCHLNKTQASLYQSIVDELSGRVILAEGIERKGLILSTLTKLKQVCDHPLLLSNESLRPDDSGKIKRFLDILDPIFEHREKTLVFTQYVQMGHILEDCIKKHYSDATVLFLHGSLTAEKRQVLIDSFRSDQSGKTVFILSLKAGGVGLNLTEATHVIHFDRWWNPAVEEQATDRAYRIGQHKNVHVYKLMCAGTLEQRIDELIEKKKNLTNQIIGNGEGWLTELDDKEIYELVRLRERVF